MANIHEQVKQGTLDVMHQGTESTFEMPNWMQELGKADTLQDTEKIIYALNEEGILLGFLHSGLKECIVGLRAHIRPKDGESILESDKCGDPLAYKPKPQDVPGTKSTKNITPEQAIKTLQNTMTKEQLLEMIQQMDNYDLDNNA